MRNNSSHRIIELLQWLQLRNKLCVLLLIIALHQHLLMIIIHLVWHLWVVKHHLWTRIILLIRVNNRVLVLRKSHLLSNELSWSHQRLSLLESLILKSLSLLRIISWIMIHILCIFVHVLVWLNYYIRILSIVKLVSPIKDVMFL